MSADPGNEKCAGCGDAADAECRVWGQPLCYPCAQAWDREAPSEEEAARKYPVDEDRYRALKEFTAKWAEKRRAKARAA